MRYYATVRDETRMVEVEALGGSRFRVSIDGGPPHEIDAERIEGHSISLLVDRRCYDVDLEEEGETLSVLVEDELFRLEMLDERKLRLKQARGKFAVAGPQMVLAPMPGKVVKLLVKPGDEVTEGQGVVVVEAMKMENELRSPKAGRVGKVFVSEGQTVEGRADLVSIE